jgi:hypothetical protein
MQLRKIFHLWLNEPVDVESKGLSVPRETKLDIVPVLRELVG